MPVRYGDSPLFFSEQSTGWLRRRVVRLFMRSLNIVIVALYIKQVAELDHPDLPPDLKDPSLPVVVENRVVPDGEKSGVVFQSMPAERFELIEENSLRSRRLGAVGGLESQDLDRHAKIEPSSIVFRFLDQICLKRGEVVSQPAHRRPHDADVAQLAQKKVDRHRQLGGGEHFLPGLFQKLLQGDVVGKPFADDAKKIRLFDVFLARQHDWFPRDRFQGDIIPASAQLRDEATSVLRRPFTWLDPAPGCKVDSMAGQQFSSIPAAVDAIARGEVIIVVDAEDRENEGDYICAAEKATPAVVNFMIGGHGQLCAPILPDVAHRLDLSPIVKANTAPLQTGFLTPIDHRTVKTGITAEERSRTILALADGQSTANDFVRPGHVYPLLAKEGGVLRRAGHTEAAVDLCRMAGLAPVGVLCEILDPEGNRASREHLATLAEQKNLAIISIEQLIAHRRVSEKLVSRSAEARLPTRYGEFSIVSYEVQFENQEPLALVLGDVAKHPAPLVRIHSSCFTGDLLDSLRCDCGDQLHMALQMISREGAGVVVYLPQEGRGIGLAQKIKAYSLQDKGLDTVEANVALGYKADLRDYGVGIQVLKDLGLRRIRLLTNNPKKTEAFVFGGFDLHVVDQIPIQPSPNLHNVRYLSTKRDKLGHRLPADVQPAGDASE